nr:MAG TPA: hypothetical protein [Caudoviricetes sp.]
MVYLTSLNLKGNELQNAVLHPLTVAPANPKLGQIYYNSADKFIYAFDGEKWTQAGAVYVQGSTTGAVITGLDATGKVTTTNVTGLTLTGYDAIEGGYVTADMTLEAAMKAVDTALKNVVAEGGEPNQNAFSHITVKKQSDAVTAVAGASADVTLNADAKTDTFSVASGNKWVDIAGEGKNITIGHSLSGVTAGAYGDSSHSAAITVDQAGHITAVTAQVITPDTIGADKAGSASAVLGAPGDTSDKVTVYGVQALAKQAQADAATAESIAQEKVASVTATADKGIEIGGSATEPTVGIKLDDTTGNAATLSAKGLMVTIPAAAEYAIAKLETATDGYLATYQLQKNGTAVGVNIDIPKDYLVKSASIKTATANDPSGFAEGTKYIDFVINTKVGTGNEDHIYLNVEELIDLYTAGNGIEVSEANVISVKVVSENGLSLDATGIKLSLASGTAAGAMSSAHYTKLEGIEAGATKNTITLNGTATKTPSFYAPIAGGTKGQILISNGANTAPTFQDMPETFHKYSATNTALTAAGGAFTWTIAAATHGVNSDAIIVQLFEVATGNQVIADVSINGTSHDVKIIINDVASAGTLTAGTYKVVIFG